MKYFVTYGKNVYGKKEIASVIKVIKKTTQMGKSVDKFEKEISKITGKKFTVMCNSGSSACLILSEILDLKSGDEFIVPALNFPTAIVPFLKKGLIPKVVDINLDDLQIDIDLIKVQKSKEHKNIIKLDDAYSMKLRYPSFEQFIGNNFEINDNVSDVTKSLDMITSCIEMVYDKEENWNASECSKKELTEFVDQLNSKQFKEIEKFFETMPKLSHTVKVKNPNTNVESDVVLEGLASFFS